MNILVIQSCLADPIGVFGEHLVRQGAALFVWLTEQQDAPPKSPSADGYDGLIVLGGYMNAHEDEKFPHLRATVDLIRQFHQERKPIMGICLGAQLVARAFGSQVYVHSAPELGFGPVRMVDEAALDPLLKDVLLKDVLLKDVLLKDKLSELLSDELFFMQWHFDTFDLPAEATLLMTNDRCKHQAYRIGDTTYAFQFHFEVTPEIVLNWLSKKTDWIAQNYPHLESQIKAQLQIYEQGSAEFAQHIATRWLALFHSKILA